MTLEQLPYGQRILVGTAAPLTSYKRGSDGEPANPGTTTVTVTRADGEVVATAAATTESGTTNQLSFTLTPTQNNQLDWLTAVWTDADGSSWTTYHEVVGGFYFSRNQAIGEDPKFAEYTSEQLLAARTKVERELESEQMCNRAFVPRYRRVRVRSKGRCHLILPDADIRSVRSVTAYYTATSSEAFAASDLAELHYTESGVMTRVDGVDWPCADLIFEYEYGWNQPPDDLMAAILRRTRWTLGRPSSGVPERATSFSVDNGGSYSLAQPGRNDWLTADPDVDFLVRRYRFERAGIG